MVVPMLRWSIRFRSTGGRHPLVGEGLGVGVTKGVRVDADFDRTAASDRGPPAGVPPM